MVKAISTLPIGAKVKSLNTKYLGDSIIWLVGDKNNASYPANSVSLITEKIISSKAFDAREPNNSDGNIQSAGNNRYLHSNLRQWLNKSGPSWYTAQHDQDQAPNSSYITNPGAYDAEAGFLSNFESDFLNAILPTTLTVARNTVTAGGGSETVQDKIFLPSNTEVGLANENSIVEGFKWALFTNDNSRKAYPTQKAINQTSYADSSSFNTSSPWYWWLRTPHAGYSNYVRYVSTVGALSSYYAYNGFYGVRPALNLPSGILVSDAPDSDGAYIIQWNALPTISGSDTTHEPSVNAPIITYSVNDTDLSDTLTVTEKIDGTVVNTINDAVRNQTYTTSLGSNWASLTLDTHTLTITVSDGKASATRTHTVTKIDDRIIFKGKNAIETSIAAKEIVFSGIFNLAEGATLQIEACNNGFDANPNWEDITASYENQEAYTFVNDHKTASKWGVNYRVTVLRNDATDKSYVEAVGLNFGRG